MDYVVIDKGSVFIDSDAVIGKNVIIYENNRIDGNCVIEDNVTIFPNSYISNSIIGKGSKIYSSIIENSTIGERSYISPFVVIRFSKLKKGSKIVSFSNIKNKEL